MQIIQEGYRYAAISASANVSNGATGQVVAGVIGGFFVSSTTSGTIAIYDDVATGTATPILATFTPAASGFFLLNAKFSKGVYVVLGGTIAVTILYATANGD